MIRCGKKYKKNIFPVNNDSSLGEGGGSSSYKSNTNTCTQCMQYAASINTCINQYPVKH